MVANKKKKYFDYIVFIFFFFQAEDGIRDGTVTGVQTCALPIWPGTGARRRHRRPESVEDAAGRNAGAIRRRGGRRDRPDRGSRVDHRPRLRAAVEHARPERGRGGEAPGRAAQAGARRHGVTTLLPHVEPEVADLAVADDVILALEPELALGADVGERTLDGNQLVVAHHLGADEAARDVRVHGPGGVLRARLLGNGPRPYFVLTDGEERDEAEERVAVSEHAPDRRLLQS